jgi:HSP20 family protein
MPGIDPDRDVELTVADGMLQVRARREERDEKKGRNEYRSEFRYGEFVRTVPLPPGVKVEDIKASYKDGILEIRVPVGAEAESSVKRIAVARG